MSRPKKYLVSQSLISSYHWIFKKDNGYEDFLKTLNREQTQQTRAMLDGIKFEGMVQATCEGNPLDESHKWYKPVTEIAEIVKGGAYQAKIYRDLKIGNTTFIVYGVLDFLKAGIIYDTKFSTTYKVGKYLDSPQHPFYMYLVPEAEAFEYLVSDGEFVYKEKYYREDICSPESLILPFMGFLDKYKLMHIYTEKWLSRY